MTLLSMTGFARREGHEALHGSGQSWVWELRAVNGKGLDVRLRLPHGFERLEPQTRQLLSEKLSRGSIQASLTIKYEKASMIAHVNHEVLASLTQAIVKIDQEITTRPSSAAEILALRGVMELVEEPQDEGDLALIDAAVLKGLAAAIESLLQHRANEGAALAVVLNKQIDAIEQLAQGAEKDPSLTPEVITARLREQIDHITQGDAGLDEARLYKEAVIQASKMDIREELDRLMAHCSSIRALLAKGSPVGRKLEFLAQELNRECNTLCAKSNAVSLTERGLEMKLIIDQFREQVLNVE